MHRDGTPSELDAAREDFEDAQQRIAEIRAEVYRHGGPEYALVLLAEIDRLRVGSRPAATPEHKVR